MNERVEEIRRQVEEIVRRPKNPEVYEDTLIRDFTDALAQAEQDLVTEERLHAESDRLRTQLAIALDQAERDVQTWKDMGEKEHALAVQFAKEKEQAERARDSHFENWRRVQAEVDAARAEVERLKRHLGECHTRATTAEADLARVRAVAEKVLMLDISPMFDAKGTYSRRKSEELDVLKYELRAALEGRR